MLSGMSFLLPPPIPRARMWAESVPRFRHLAHSQPGISSLIRLRNSGHRMGGSFFRLGWKVIRVAHNEDMTFSAEAEGVVVVS